MDLFTHILFPYTIAFGLFGQSATNYIAAAALGGGLPDADILLYPLTKAFPRFKHHGITHSIIGVTVFSLIMAFLAVCISVGDYFLFFVAFEIGGLTHLALDGFTNFSIPPFSPLSERQLHADADVAVNLVVTAGSISAFFILLFEKGSVPMAVWTYTVWTIFAAYICYFSVRGIMRLRVNIRVKTLHANGVIPTINPLIWLIVKEIHAGKSYTIKYWKYHVGHKLSGKTSILHVNPNRITGPVKTTQEAINRSYDTAVKHMPFMRDAYKFAQATLEGKEYRVYWFSPEFIVSKRTFGVTVHVNRNNGVLRLKRSFEKVHFL
ncbi:MAG: metal-dependent hydrolase [Candidatus Parvarchaeota archaeon]|nr:metal-dependent hydrolase [Candidatus Parvarchaeota archaeon]